MASVVPQRKRLLFGFLLLSLLVETLFFVVLSPLLPVYARTLHLSRLAAGVMSASYSLGYGAASVPAGALVGVLGQRAVALGGLMLVGLSCLAFAAAGEPATLDAARALTGVGAAAVWAGTIPWLVSLGPPADRGRLIGLAFAAASAGACVGPAVGALATLIGPRRAFIGLGVMIVALVPTGLWISRRHTAPVPERLPGRLRDAVRAPGTVPAIGMVALPSVGFGVAGVLLPLRLHGLGVAEAVIAAAFLGASLLEVIANPLVGRWFDRRGGSRVLVCTLLASALCALVVAMPLSAPALVVALVAILPAMGSVWVPSLAQLSATVERAGAQPGVALGLFNLTWAASQIAGALGGAQLSRAGEAVPFLVLAALFAVGARTALTLA